MLEHFTHKKTIMVNMGWTPMLLRASARGHGDHGPLRAALALAVLLGTAAGAAAQIVGVPGTGGCAQHQSEFPGLIGFTEAEAIAAIEGMPGIRTVQVGGPATPMSRDYRPERATLLLRAGGWSGSSAAEPPQRAWIVRQRTAPPLRYRNTVCRNGADPMRPRPAPPPARRHDSTLPILLILGAFGLWLFLMSTYIAVLPDHLASPDQSERMAWSGD